ncbi:hypothetical protein F5Y13DRAFT_194816 [Hypoxylon sp. FL1857]|nr:hypothetical protein F5Y13DRAFT_194816 [Hypoxylon sp. FL1857]
MSTTQAPIVDHPTALGRVDPATGNFVCGIPGCHPLRPIANKRENISSHLSKEHLPGGAYERKSARNPRRCGICGPHSRTWASFHTLEKHIRSNTNTSNNTSSNNKAVHEAPQLRVVEKQVNGGDGVSWGEDN